MCHKWLSFLALAGLFCSGACPAFVKSKFTGNAPDVESRASTLPPEELSGSLVIVGGGTVPDAIRQRFVDLAGGKDARIVLIPTASAIPEKSDNQAWKKYGCKSVQTLHTQDREKANDPAFVRPLREASGVWLGGGDQTRLVTTIAGTLVEKELHQLLARGGVLGGTSAGAAVMSVEMIAGGMQTAKLQQGFGFLPGFLIDQHFTQRQRQARLWDALRQKPGRVGLGIDEQTAVVVQRRRLTVLGAGQVTLCLDGGAAKKPRTEILRAGSVADLIAWRRSALTRTQPPFPAAQPESPNVREGTLMIGGGGRLPREVMQRFVQLAGGPDALILVIPTALEDPLPPDPVEMRLLRQAGAKNLKLLHTRRRAEANQAEFLAPLNEARGLWFSGGRQWRFVDAYEGTLAERLFHDVLKRGGVIGGSSAGASIQSEYMPRGDPLGNRNIIAEGYERGFGFLKGVAVDQHFFARRRQQDMKELISTYPQLLGIGIDEGTVCFVHGSVMEVAGAGKIGVVSANKQNKDTPPTMEELQPGMRYDLVQRKRLP